MRDAPAGDRASVQQPTQQEVLAAIITSSVLAVIGANADDIITAWNPGVELLSGYQGAEVIGQPVTVLVPPDHKAELACLTERTRRGEHIPQHETLLLHRDGRRIDVLISTTPISDDAGQVLGSALMVWEITPRKRVERELQVRARQQAAVAELSQRALACVDLSAFFDEAVTLVAHTLEIEHCTILELLPDGTALRIRAGRGWRDGVVGQALVPAGLESQAGYTLAAGRPVIVEDMRWERRFRPNTLLVEHAIVSGISVIIPGEERPYGVLSMHVRKARTFTDDDIHFLEAVGNVLAAAIKQGQVYQLLELRVAERTRELSILLDISHNLSSTLDLGPLLGLILAQLKTLVDYTSAAIFTDEGEYLRTLCYWGPLPSEQVVGQRFPIPEAPSYQEFLRNGGRPTIVDDVWGDSPLAQGYQRSKNTPVDPAYQYIRSLLVVPLIVKERVIGALRIDHSAPHAFTEHQATLALTIANQAAMAIENARLYARAQDTATMEERQRLARELHDSVTQALYSVTLYAEAAVSMLASGDQASATTYLRELGSTAQEALQEMRLLIYELRPPILEQEGLATALQARLAAVEGRTTGVQTRVAIDADLQLPARVEEALYRIAQEALNNVRKHARAHTISLSLRREGPTVTLEVTDDGAGFVQEVAGRRGGVGLHSMRERAALIGAHLTIRSTPALGTVVRVEVPYG